MSYGSVNTSKVHTDGRPSRLAQSSQIDDNGQNVQNENENENVISSSSEEVDDHSPISAEDEERQPLWQKLKGFYERNIGLVFVFMAQVFASLVRKKTLKIQRI